MNRPATIEGRAVIASTTVRTTRANRPPTSVMNTAVPMPRGSVMASAMPSWMSEPTIACRTPPCSKPSLGPTPLMSWVQKFQCSKGCQPRSTTKTMALTTAATTTSAAPVITDSATRSFTSTRPPLIDAVTAVTATPNTNQAMRNHGTPPSGSNRCVTSQARPSPAAQEPTRANRSSGLRRPRPERGIGGAASSSYAGSTVAGGGEVS